MPWGRGVKIMAEGSWYTHSGFRVQGVGFRVEGSVCFCQGGCSTGQADMFSLV